MFFSRKASQPAMAEKPSQVKSAFEADMPDVAFVRARNEYMDSVGRAVVDRARFFVIAVTLGCICSLLVIALIVLLPLKSVEPYVVAVDASRGLVGASATSVQRAASYTPERPVLERELFQFVERLYAINADYPRVVQDGHLAAYAYTRGRATTEFRNFLELEKTYLRQKTHRGLVRTIERKTISFREDGGLVLIRFRSSERTQERPVPLTRDLLLTLQFVREQSRDRTEIDSNPLGLYVTHFEIVEER
jgi:type IV secretory pathway component VirB8